MQVSDSAAQVTLKLQFLYDQLGFQLLGFQLPNGSTSSTDDQHLMIQHLLEFHRGYEANRHAASQPRHGAPVNATANTNRQSTS